MNLLIIDDLGESGIAILENDPAVSYQILQKPTQSELKEAIQTADGLIVDGTVQIDADVLAHAKTLRTIGRSGIRVRNIDVEAATRQGIMVINTPQANAVSAAEHTLALMLAVCRKIPQAADALSAGNGDRSPWMGVDLAGKTLGIVGLGAIGRLVAARAKGFDMHVIAVDPYVSELDARDLEVTLVDLDDLLTQSDVITLHTVVSEETADLINAETLSKCKDGVMLVNIASPRLIDGDAVAGGLKSGKLAGVALDGLLTADPADDPLFGLPNVIQTPGLATRSEEAIEAVSAEIVSNVLAALRGSAYRNVINMAWPKDAPVETVGPYIELAQKIGRLQAQLADHPIERIEVEISGDDMQPMVRPMAAGLLTGLLEAAHGEINRVNAPFIAKAQGLQITQEYGLGEADYSNLVTCRAQWQTADGTSASRLIAGVLFGGREPRLVQVDDYQIEAKPEGTMLVMANKDVPGVIGQVATLLATYEVNIAEWRLGRTGPGGEALSFINLDGEPPEAVVAALRQAPAVTMARLVSL